jgi:hypothetical protein
MQKHTCLGRHTNLHVSAKLSLKLSELNKYRNSFTIFFSPRKIRQFIFQENPLRHSPFIIRLQSKGRAERVLYAVRRHATAPTP